MYKKIMILGLMASAAFCPCKPAFSETLQETVAQALAAHPALEGALAGKDMAAQDKNEARSGFFPTVSAGTSIGRIYSDNSTSRGLTVSRGAAYSGLWEANAALTQPIFNGMETKNRMDAAQARMLSADYNVADVKENLALQATQAHIGVLQAQATLDRTKSYFAAIEDYLSRIQLMVDEGVADESEVAQARNISLMLQSTLVDYEGQLETALANYREVVGQAPRSTLLKPLHITAIEEDMNKALSYASANHPLLKSNKKEMDALEYDIKAEKGTLYPDLDAEFSGIKRDQKEEIGGELKDARALLKLNWDFEVGGASKARVRKTQAQYSEIAAQNEEYLRTIEGDIRRAYAELETAEQQVDLVQKREVVTTGLFEAYKTQFEGARVRLLQLMQSENQLFNAQLEVIAAEYRHLLAQYNVLASIGKLQVSVAAGAQPTDKPIEYVVEVKEKPQEVIQPEIVQEVVSPELVVEAIKEDLPVDEGRPASDYYDYSATPEISERAHIVAE